MPRARKSAAAPAPAGLIKMRPYQEEAFWAEYGLQLWLWARQRGKSRTMAAKAMHWMGLNPGCLVTYASASLLLGTELAEKEAALFYSTLDEMRKQAESLGMLLRLHAADREAAIDDINVDDFKDLFTRQKLQTRLYHSPSIYSRTQVIAPNIATARGWSGFVLLDEIWFIEDFRGLWEAVEPIISSSPLFQVRMCTTIGRDDSHFAYEMAAPPEGTTFEVNPRGNWYRSQAGIRVHRVDVYDAEACGVKTYDMDSRKEITAAEAKAKAMDRDAYARNFELIMRAGGINALDRAALRHAMEAGASECFAIDREDLPADWMARAKVGDGPIALGYDVATTENKTSNPSALTVGEKVGHRMVARFTMRWKSADPDDCIELLKQVVTEMYHAGKKLRRLCVDGSNERFHAVNVKRALIPWIIVEIVVSSTKTTYKAEEMDMKTYLGNLFSNAVQDGEVLLAQHEWLRKDMLLVKKEKGRFVTETDTSGNHGDTFDSSKLALYGLRHGSGPVEATGVQVGRMEMKAPRAGIRNPYAPENLPAQEWRAA